MQSRSEEIKTVLKTFLLVPLTLCLLACKVDKHERPVTSSILEDTGSINIEEACFPGFAQKETQLNESEFFPKESFFKDPQMDKSSAIISSKYLKRMRESSIWQQHESKKFQIRFTWLRSFHDPISITIQYINSEAIIKMKQLKFLDSGNSSEMTVDSSHLLTSKEWKNFVDVFNDACLWRMHSQFLLPLPTDSAAWTVEVSWKGYYHIVNRISPDSGKFRELCLLMLILASPDFDLSSESVY
jgi:hypothetical protein